MEKSTKILLISVTFLVLLLVLYFVFKKLTKAKKPQEYQAKYPSSYICLDGHRVRSLSEMVIDNFFHRNGIQHEYEDVILKSVNNAEKQYKYDWYFPKIDLYVEFFGYSGNTYKENTEAKKIFYRKHNLKMISLIPMDLANIPETIPEKIGKDWEKIVIAKHCPNCGETLDRRT